MTLIGTVESIWRYPVKSMCGEELEAGFVSFAGLMGDRAYSFVKASGNPGFPWHTARDQEALLLYRPRYRHPNATLQPQHLDAAQALGPGINPLYPEAEQFAVEVETPSGDTYALEDTAFLDHLKSLAEDPDLRLHFSHRSQYDCRPLSLFSLQLRDQLAAELGIELDKRRFRANLYVQWQDDKPPLFENELIGQRLRLGDSLEITILERDPRCKMITLDPQTAEANPAIIKHVSRAHEGYAGVYGAVLVEGVVKAGDRIELL